MEQGLVIRPLTGVIGAEIEGVDLRQPMSRNITAELRKLLNKHQVLVFRDQPITAQQQHEFALNFGSVVKSAVDPVAAPFPGVTVVHSANAKNLTDEWHTDHTYVPIPPMAAMLHAVTLPSSGGDTLWMSTTAAYDALTAPMRNFLDGLTASHDTERARRQMTEAGLNFTYSMERVPVTHPVVRVHPETGRKALFVCSLYTTHINELSEDESRNILSFLYEHMKSPPFQLRVNWRPHTSVLWDERSTLHYAVPDYDEPRIMHRLMIEGTRPFGAGEQNTGMGLEK